MHIASLVSTSSYTCLFAMLPCKTIANISSQVHAGNNNISLINAENADGSVE